jgi:hypothetical protein
MIYQLILCTCLVSVVSGIPSWLPGGGNPACRDTFCEEFRIAMELPDGKCITFPATHDLSCSCVACYWNHTLEVCAIDSLAVTVCLYTRSISSLVFLGATIILITILIIKIGMLFSKFQKWTSLQSFTIFPWYVLVWIGVIGSYAARTSLQNKEKNEILLVSYILNSVHLAIISVKGNIDSKLRLLALLIFIFCSVMWSIASVPYSEFITTECSILLQYTACAVYQLFLFVLHNNNAYGPSSNNKGEYDNYRLILTIASGVTLSICFWIRMTSMDTSGWLLLPFGILLTIFTFMLIMSDLLTFVAGKVAKQPAADA